MIQIAEWVGMDNKNSCYNQDLEKNSHTEWEHGECRYIKHKKKWWNEKNTRYAEQNIGENRRKDQLNLKRNHKILRTERK
jgi:hypothetical protein